MSGARSLLFVYGTLMRGERSAGLLSSARLLDGAARVERHALVDAGAYPGMVRSEGGAVLGELYEVTLEDLEVLDEFEGHPDLFQRIEVELVSGIRAFAYLFRRLADQPSVADGDWRGYRMRRDAPS